MFQIFLIIWQIFWWKNIGTISFLTKKQSYHSSPIRIKKKKDRELNVQFIAFFNKCDNLPGYEVSIVLSYSSWLGKKWNWMHKYATSAKCPNIVTVCRWKQFPFALFETSPWVHLGQRSIFPKCKAFHMLDKQNHLLLFYISFYIFTFLKTLLLN